MRNPTYLVAVITVCASLAMAQTKATEVKNTSYEANGMRVLRHEGVVQAPLERTWETFTTAEGLRTFAVPVVEFELKTGGKFHSNYRAGSRIGDPGTIRNTVLSYIPLRMVSFKIGLTEQFPPGPREAGTVFTVVEFESQTAGSTKVTISMLGWGSGADWDDVYKRFEWGNGYTLEKLQERFIHGPATWPLKEQSLGSKDQGTDSTSR